MMALKKVMKILTLGEVLNLALDNFHSLDHSSSTMTHHAVICPFYPEMPHYPSNFSE
jgi:hypothetical protein